MSDDKSRIRRLKKERDVLQVRMGEMAAEIERLSATSQSSKGLMLARLLLGALILTVASLVYWVCFCGSFYTFVYSLCETCK